MKILKWNYLEYIWTLHPEYMLNDSYKTPTVYISLQKKHTLCRQSKEHSILNSQIMSFYKILLMESSKEVGGIFWKRGNPWTILTKFGNMVWEQKILNNFGWHWAYLHNCRKKPKIKPGMHVKHCIIVHVQIGIPAYNVLAN